MTIQFLSLRLQDSHEISVIVFVSAAISAEGEKRRRTRKRYAVSRRASPSASQSKLRVRCAGVLRVARSLLLCVVGSTSALAPGPQLCACRVRARATECARLYIVRRFAPEHQKETIFKCYTRWQQACCW